MKFPSRMVGGPLLAGALLLAMNADAQKFEANYDEAKIPAYTLPDPLVTASGKPVTSAKQWENTRRPELLEAFRSEMYGKSPAKPKNLRFEVGSVATNALGGKATRKEIWVHLTKAADGPRMQMLLYVPNAAPHPVPAFLGLNFQGNHAVQNDLAISLPQSWLPASREGAVKDNRATDAGRGGEASRWPVEKIIDAGFALATIYYGDVEPDFAEGWKKSLRGRDLKEGETPGPDAWGAIAAWSWGLSRGLDYLEKDRDVNARQVAVIGHSRLGKTSLWAGAEDERFAVVISNNSGCGGASLNRRQVGETVWRINNSFPHWFCGNFKKYNNREGDLPFDQHELIALIAPRPVYVASAEEDKWADPKGEFLGAKLAEPVYALFGKKGLGVEEMPAVNQPVGDVIGYHMRTGKHDVTDYDWDQYLKFARRHFAASRKAK